jgi:hypothetical protein
MIVGFDLATTEVSDIVVGVIHVGFFMKQLCGWKYIQILMDNNGPSYEPQKLGSSSQALGPLK